MKPLHVIMAVVGGALAGAAVGMLFAPKKGRHTRRDIYRYLREHGIDMRQCQIENILNRFSDDHKEIKKEIKKELRKAEA